MKRIAWMVVLAAAALAAGAASGRGRVDYSEVTAESLVTSPQSSWARAILFTDEVVAPPSAKWKRLERKNYAEMRLRTVGTVWIPSDNLSAFEGLQPGRLYSFGGTVDQFSRRYYVILDAVFELQTGDDLSEHWTGMLDGGAGEDDPALQGVLLQVQNRLIQMAKEQGVTVEQLVEAQTDGGQRLAQVVAAEAMQSEFRAKNTTAEEVLIDSVLALLQKQAVMGGGEGAGTEGGEPVAEVAEPVDEEAPAETADGLSMDGWDGEAAAGEGDVAGEIAEGEESGESASFEDAAADLPEVPAIPEASAGEAAEGDWWEELDGDEVAAEESVEGVDDILAGVEAMEDGGENVEAEVAADLPEIPDLLEEEAVSDGESVEMPETFDGAEEEMAPVWEEDIPAVLDELPEDGEWDTGAEDGFTDIPVTAEDGEGDADMPEAMGDGLAEMPEDFAGVEPGEEDEVPVAEIPAVEEPMVGGEPVAEVSEPVAEAGEARIVPLGGGVLTPRVSLEPTREELEAAAKQAEAEARAAEAEARRLEKEAKEEAKRQEKERKEAEAEARRLEKAAAAAAAARAQEEEYARRAAEKTLAKRLKEEAKAAAREEESRREALAAQQAAAVEAARAAERIRKAEAAALAEREAHAVQMKEAEARKAAALAALEAAEREKAAALAKIEAEREAEYAAVEAVRAVERAEKLAQHETALAQARQIEEEERKAAEAAERRIAKAAEETAKERARLAEVEAEARAAERAAADAGKESAQLKKRAEGKAVKPSRGEEKARLAEEKRLRREAEEAREAAERKAKAEADRLAKERRAAEAAKSKEAAKPKPVNADFWSQPAKW